MEKDDEEGDEFKEDDKSKKEGERTEEFDRRKELHNGGIVAASGWQKEREEKRESTESASPTIESASPTILRQSGFRDTRRASYVHYEEGVRYIGYAGEVTDKGGLSGEGALSMGFIRLMDVDSGVVVQQMGVNWFKGHNRVVGVVADLEVVGASL